MSPPPAPQLWVMHLWDDTSSSLSEPSLSGHSAADLASASWPAVGPLAPLDDKESTSDSASAASGKAAAQAPAAAL